MATTTTPTTTPPTMSVVRSLMPSVCTQYRPNMHVSAQHCPLQHAWPALQHPVPQHDWPAAQHALAPSGFLQHSLSVPSPWVRTVRWWDGKKGKQSVQQILVVPISQHVLPKPLWGGHGDACDA